MSVMGREFTAARPREPSDYQLPQPRSAVLAAPRLRPRQPLLIERR